MVVRIFISYCHKDEAHRNRLAKHMAPLLREKDVEAWFDGDIEPGKAITPEIRKALRDTDIFVALGSSDYLHSDYCYRKEYRSTLRRSRQGRPRVVVALVGICDWPHTEMAAYKMLPNDAKSVEEHGRRNRAYFEIVLGIRRIVRSVRQEKGKEQKEIERMTAGKAKRPASMKARVPTKAVPARSTKPKAMGASMPKLAKPPQTAEVGKKSKRPLQKTTGRASGGSRRKRTPKVN